MTFEETGLPIIVSIPAINPAAAGDGASKAGPESGARYGAVMGDGSSAGSDSHSITGSVFQGDAGDESQQDGRAIQQRNPWTAKQRSGGTARGNDPRHGVVAKADAPNQNPGGNDERMPLSAILDNRDRAKLLLAKVSFSSEAPIIPF